MDNFTQYGWFGAVAIFLLKEAWVLIKGDTKHYVELIQENVKITKENTMELRELKVHFQYIKGKLERVDKLSRDVDEAHARIRLLQKDSNA